MWQEAEDKQQYVKFGLKIRKKNIMKVMKMIQEPRETTEMPMDNHNTTEQSFG